jgi:hypothetical protein
MPARNPDATAGTEPIEPDPTTVAPAGRASWVSTSLHTRGGICSYVRMLQSTPLAGAVESRPPPAASRIRIPPRALGASSASLELRPPFLDHRLVELAFSIPSRLKVRRGTTKRIVKEVARRYLPGTIADRRRT